MKLTILQIILFFLIPIWVLAEIILFIMVLRSKPSKDLLNKYSKKDIYGSSSDWRKNIANGDIKIIEKYQYKIKIFSWSLYGAFFLIMFVLITLALIDYVQALIE